jgi:hypothetical protein
MVVPKLHSLLEEELLLTTIGRGVLWEGNLAESIHHALPRNGGVAWKIVKRITDKSCLPRKASLLGYFTVGSNAAFRNETDGLPDELVGVLSCLDHGFNRFMDYADCDVAQRCMNTNLTFRSAEFFQLL